MDKDKIIDSLKEAVINKENKLKQARLETITAYFEDIKYPTAEHKQNVIQSLSSSELELEFIRGMADDLRRSTGIHGHYR